ncbi:hypothetical protein SAMN02745136_05079 [Anaerocolumna jejuensis DSM 15929]|uniref:Uncharacterized protein n=1 Tax=Anaerocolumna jejuensis DSM 15929 TaxID=1121322 RepID=A0A1M7BCD7_9FIRM|nr:hypothetical protein [Anaerocolumna jejuensis]SHL52581.1 hypothetical protein SAMN02745136_05079 [Anaerocolumna jejuensis DSM 15929]
MDYFGAPFQDFLQPSSNIIRVENAVIEEVNVETCETGYILISYTVPLPNSGNQNEQIRLNVSRYTIIISQYGAPLSLCNLEVGMRVNAEFSAAVTSSIPPQSSAYSIIVIRDESNTMVTTDRVVSNDAVNGVLTTGNPFDLSEQISFIISDDTIIIGRNGNRIPLGQVKPGQMVIVEHADFQTMSIPPQSPAYRVKVI